MIRDTSKRTLASLDAFVADEGGVRFEATRRLMKSAASGKCAVSKSRKDERTATVSRRGFRSSVHFEQNILRVRIAEGRGRQGSRP